MKRIVVCVITYNQEDVIRRALDSVLCQREWGLYRIVVSDDCSNDRTWQILQEYQKQYPEIVYPYRNEHNLGIYENLAKAESYLPDYDLLGNLSGDDAYCDGYFESVQKLIESQHIDTDESVGIFSDWKSITPNGVESVFKQKSVLSGHNLWSLKARGKITARSFLISKKVQDSLEPVLKGKGLNLTESHRDSQPMLKIKKVYYIPQVTTIYYTGIGIATQLSIKHSDYLTYQSIEKWNYFIDNYVKTQRDLHYAQYELLKSYHYLTPSFIKLIKMLYHYELGQLPGCRSTLRATARTFRNLTIYWLTFDRNSINNQ